MKVSANKSPYRDIDRIPCGLPALDRLTNGGIPRKFTTELLGKAGTGKSTLALFIIREAQKQGLKCFYADVERTFAFDMAERLGIDLKKLEMFYAETAEEYLNEIITGLEKKKYDLIVLDSIGALAAQDDYQNDLTAKGFPVLASLMTRLVPKIVSKLGEANAAFIVVNHQKTDMQGNMRTLGGAALMYHKALSIKLYHNGTNLKQGDEIVGKVVMAKLEKIKPFLGGTAWGEVKLQYLATDGFSVQADLLDEAIDRLIIRKEGGSYFLGDDKIAYGLPKMRIWLAENEEKIKELMV